MASKHTKLYNKNRKLLECVKSHKPIAVKLLEVRRCLDQRAEVNTTDEDGNTPLYLAVIRVKASLVVKLLLKRGANVNAQDKHGDTVLYEALFYKDTSMVQLLLNNGAEVCMQNKDGETPLHIAAYFGVPAAVELLLCKGAYVDAKDEDGCTPLHVAAGCGMTCIVKQLLNKHAHLDAKNRTEDTPLHVAVSCRMMHIVELLLNNGANVNASNFFGSTPLHEAVKRKNADAVQLLLNKHAHVDAKDNDRHTPLHLAVSYEVPYIVELLLNKGANVNTKNLYGITPLLTAVLFGYVPVVKLLQKDAKIISQSTSKYAPLHTVGRHRETPYKETPIIELLLDKGADVNMGDMEGTRPLHEAARFGRMFTVELLLNKGANINAQNLYSDTPLHKAVCFGHANIATLLVRRGADVMLRDRTGNTAFTSALLFFDSSIDSYEDIVRILQAAEKEARENYMLDKNRSHNLLRKTDIANNTSLKIVECKYFKSNNTSGFRGQLYETKLPSLILIRLLNHEQIEHDFFLGVNVKNIGDLDDICLRYRVKGRQRPVMLVMQAKHRDDPETSKVTEGAMWRDSGDYSLWKYFKSYLMIKERFMVNNDPMFEGKFQDVDCYFILYTSAKENFTKKKIANEISETVHDLINTKQTIKPFQFRYDDADIERFAAVAAEVRAKLLQDNFTKKKIADEISETVHDLINTKQTIKPFQFHYDDSDIECLAAVAAEAHAELLQVNPVTTISIQKLNNEEVVDYFSKLWFYTSQANEEKLEYLVKNEINKYYNNEKTDNNYEFEVHTNAIFLKSHEKIQKWWRLKEEAPYLCRSDDFFRYAKLECLYNVLLNVCMAIDHIKIGVDLEFKKQFLHNTTIGTPKSFNTILWKLLKIIDTENQLININVDFKNETMNSLFTNKKLAGENTILSSDQSDTLGYFLKRDQDVIFKNDLHNEQPKYSKRDGTSEAGGALFRTKALTLIFLRVLNHEKIVHDPLVGSKLRGISVMSDICLRFRAKGQLRPVALFMQLIHREDPEKGKLSEKSLWSDSDDFSLCKYYKSYLMIKEQFQVAKNDPMFEGEFRDVDCYFILYTSAREILVKKKTEHKLNELVQDLINTGHNTEPFQLDNDEVNIGHLTKVAVMDQIENLGLVFFNIVLSEKYDPNIMTKKRIMRYHVALAREVLQPCEIQPGNAEYRLWKFRSEFFNSDIEYLVALKRTVGKILSSDYCNPNTVDNELQQNLTDKDRQKLESLKIKLPLSFGNLDMSFRGNKNKVEKRVVFLADALMYLIKLHKDTKIVEINDEDVGPEKIIQQGFIDVNGGIGSAVGNLLVFDTDSHMLKFELGNVALPQNAALFLKELQHDRHKPMNKDLSVYRFKININNYPTDSFNASFLSLYEKTQARDFLQQFWLYFDQAKETEVERILKDEVNKKYYVDDTRHSRNNIRDMSDLISLHSHDAIQKWWLQTTESPYLSRASELFERAELADIYNLLQTVINYMYLAEIYSLNIKVTGINTELECKQIHEVLQKIVSKLFKLFDPQSNDWPLHGYQYQLTNKATLSLKVHPEMEWVALTVMTKFENGEKHYFAAKAGPKSQSQKQENYRFSVQVHTVTDQFYGLKNRNIRSANWPRLARITREDVGEPTAQKPVRGDVKSFIPKY